MGLDLYHLKALRTPRKPEDYLGLEYFSQIVLDEYGFRQYVRGYETDECIYHVLFIADPNAYAIRVARASAEGGGRDTTLVPGPYSADELSRIERQMGLDPKQRQISRCRVEAYGLTYVEESVAYFRPTIAQAIFYEEVGYQRKWMTGRFYERYDQWRVHVDRRCFLDLPSYLYEDAPAVVRENLQQAFVAAFEPGTSMLYASW